MPPSVFQMQHDKRNNAYNYNDNCVYDDDDCDDDNDDIEQTTKTSSSP